MLRAAELLDDELRKLEPAAKKARTNSWVGLFHAITDRFWSSLGPDELELKQLIASIPESDRAKIIGIFQKLHALGILYKDNKALFEDLVHHRDYFTGKQDIAATIAMLYRLNLKHEDNPSLFLLLFRCGLKPTAITQTGACLVLLDQLHVPYQGDLSLCRYALELPNALQTLLALLKEAEITALSHPDLQELINRIMHFNYEQLNIVKQIIKIKAPLTTEIIELIQYSEFDAPLKLIEVLIAAGLYPIDCPTFYRRLMSTYNEMYLEVTQALLRLKVPRVNMAEILETPHKYKLFDLFTDLKINYRTHPDFFQKRVVEKSQLILSMQTKLQQAGFSLENHRALFIKLLGLFDHDDMDPQTIFLKLNKLCAYAQQNTLLTRKGLPFNRQQARLSAMVSDNEDKFFPAIEQGPLNKSECTQKIEHLLLRISQTPITHVQFRFEEPDSYLLKLPGTAEINLSLLIRNGNFTQLTLDEDLIERIGRILESLIPRQWKDDQTLSAVVNLLPVSHRKALSLYTHRSFKNINRLFRGEPLAPPMFLPSNPSNSMAVYFLLGCLVSDASNKIRHLPYNTPERTLIDKIAHQLRVDPLQKLTDENAFAAFLQRAQKAALIDEPTQNTLKTQLEKIRAYYSHSVVLDRGETLPPEVLKARTANPGILPALSSFSAYPLGLKDFNQAGSTNSKLTSPHSNFFVNADEREVLFAQGLQTVTVKGPDFYTLRMVNSPALYPKNHYRSDTALWHVYKHFLAKPYKNEVSYILVNGTTIVRHAHGLAHTFRVMNAIDQVIHYFSEHAIDAEFKHFCQTLSDENKEWLRVAAAFSVTGRESEDGFHDNPELYYQYRQASCNNFSAFMDAPGPQNEALKACFKEVILEMGNPEFELNEDELDPEEKKLRGFYHRILTVAHDLDLPRWYEPEKFNKSMRFCQNLSAPSDAQKERYNEMIRYQIGLIKAHGDHLATDMDLNGDLIAVDVDYQDVFAEASTSMKRVFELAQTVSNPITAKMLRPSM